MKCFVFGFVFVVWAFAYSNVFSTVPCMDDLDLIAHVSNYGWTYFVKPSEITHYRPIQSLVLSTSFLLFGGHKFALLVNLLIFISSAFVLYRIIRHFSVSLEFSVLVIVLYAFHSIQTASLIQIDTLSQTLVNFFTFTSLLLFLKLTETPSIKYYIYTSLSLIGLIFSKETSLGLLVALPFATLLPEKNANQITYRPQFRISMLIIFCLLILYFLLKIVILENLIYIPNSDSTLNFNPANILNNLILAAVSVVYLGNSAFYSLERYFSFEMLFSIFISLVCLTVVIRYLVHLGLKARKIGSEFYYTAYVVLLFLASNFPMAFAQHIGELYSYQIYPYYCILLALAASHYWKTPKERLSVLKQTALIVICFTFVAVSFRSIQYKIEHFTTEGKYSQKLLQAHLNKISVEEFKKICRTPEENAKRYYSIYFMSNENLIWYIQNNLETIYGEKSPYLYKCPG